MTQSTIQYIASELQFDNQAIQNTLQLFEEGATIPFISRYRKEMTGGLDEVAVASIQSKYNYICDLQKRKETILKSIEQQDKLTPELKKRIQDTLDSTQLEDIYLPYKSKRRTKAQIAKEKGLEPLAKIILAQKGDNILACAKKFLSNTLTTTEEIISGAQDILAEWINENERSRNIVRNQFTKRAIIECKVAKGKEEEGNKYKDYFDFSQTINRMQGHRFLAIKRAEKEKIIRLSIAPDQDEMLEKLDHCFMRNETSSTDFIVEAITDSYKRLLKPSIETETTKILKQKADTEAIEIFQENLKQLLLAAPLGQTRTMGIDPGYRTGCKVVCLSAEGELLKNAVIYPHAPQNKKEDAKHILEQLIRKYQIESIAIGNGTAGRETEQFVNSLKDATSLNIFSVNEDGASIYSASDIAREEFPNEDITVRGAVSIARRLMDPLAELVKIDPKSIGVGQYQYDVDQTQLKKALDQTILSCVNLVGVNLNTASKYLLSYVSGLGPKLAQNIVDYRSENGPYKSRKELLKVPKMGKKTFEQCAGFLRISDAKNPLDNSAVHPERYKLVEQMAKDLNVKVLDLINQENLRLQIQLSKYQSSEVGLPTLKDILDELEKPGRDPRQQKESFHFDANIQTIDDIQEGAILSGIVRNLTNFGAFIDLGIKENGLIHISKMSERRIASPTEVLHLTQEIEVKVLEVDRNRKRIQLQLIH